MGPVLLDTRWGNKTTMMRSANVNLLTVSDVANILKAKPSTIYSWAEQKLIPSFKLNGLLRFDEDQIKAWIMKSRNANLCYNEPYQARSPKKGGKIHGAL
jgi:excisionase family DNA binding protein